MSYDFSQPTVVDTLNIAARIDFTANKQDQNQTMIDRVIQTNDLISYATGYLPILDAEPSVRSTKTSKAFQISDSSSKLYPPSGWFNNFTERDLLLSRFLSKVF